MRDRPLQRRRRSIRLQGYDYARAGAYFVTVCTQHRDCLFGEMVDGGLRPSPAGEMVLAVWDELAVRYRGVETDAFILMPNHIHGVLVLTGEVEGLSLPDVVHRFKTWTTKLYTEGVRDHAWPPYPGRLWQRNYYEHVIRDPASLEQIRCYIAENPARWEEDPDNPRVADRQDRPRWTKAPGAPPSSTPRPGS